MSHIISCYVLFDITSTGVLNRHRPKIDLEVQEMQEWMHTRNTQCNFDTIQQVISLRSQPEIVRKPNKIDIRLDTFADFGFLYEQNEDEVYPCWSFDFSVQHPSVFDDGMQEVGALYTDCSGVPMLKCNTSWDKLTSMLDTSDEFRNIFFKVLIND